MRYIILFFVALCISCESNTDETPSSDQADTVIQPKPQPSAPEQPDVEEDTIGTKTETEADWTAGIRSAEHTVTGVTN